MHEAYRGLSAVVLDSYPLWCEAVEHVLDRLDISVAGKATTAVAALGLVQRYRPELLVADLRVPGAALSGPEVIHRARQIVPTLQTVVLSASSDPADISSALRGGAFAYVTKDAHPDDLASAIRQAFGHSLYLSPVSPVANESIDVDVDPAVRAGLTPREREILLLAAQGLSNAAVAQQLWVTEQTIKFHLSNAYRKLGVSNRTEATHWAGVNGLLGDSQAVSAHIGRLDGVNV